MRAGLLRHRVTIQDPPATPDGRGGVSGSWTDVVTVSAEIDPLNQRDLFMAGMTHSTITHRVTMRYRSGVTSGQRLRGENAPFDGTIFQVIGKPRNREGRSRWLELMCEEVG